MGPNIPAARQGPLLAGTMGTQGFSIFAGRAEALAPEGYSQPE